MIQKNIRDFNGIEFSVAEAAEWHKEFNDRTRSSQNGYNSIDELATKVKELEVSHVDLGIEDISGLLAELNSKENEFSKNTAFNKNFGTTAGTVAQGNDVRINNGQTAFGWGDHADAGYLTALPQHSHSWANITGKPTTFPPSAHNHDGRYYTETESDNRFLGKTAKATDSYKLDGFEPASAPIADYIVRRDSAADVRARLFRSTYQTQGSISSAATITMRVNTSDNYLRHVTKAGFLSWLGSSLDARPYKVISGLITQSDDNHPTLTILENTFGETPTATRPGAGVYRITFSGAHLVTDKTFILMAPLAHNRFVSTYHNNHAVTIQTQSGSGGFADDRLHRTAIEIRVYN